MVSGCSLYWVPDLCGGRGQASGCERLGVTATASNCLQFFSIVAAITADFRYQQHVSGNTANSVGGHNASSGENSGGANQETAFAFPGGTHAGFTSLADALWRGGLRALLDGNVKGCVTHISVAGHSLGAGVATLLSYRMQVRSDVPERAAGQQTAGSLTDTPGAHPAAETLACKYIVISLPAPPPYAPV